MLSAAGLGIGGSAPKITLLGHGNAVPVGMRHLTSPTSTQRLRAPGRRLHQPATLADRRTQGGKFHSHRLVQLLQLRRHRRPEFRQVLWRAEGGYQVLLHDLLASTHAVYRHVQPRALACPHFEGYASAKREQQAVSEGCQVSGGRKNQGGQGERI